MMTVFTKPVSRRGHQESIRNASTAQAAQFALPQSGAVRRIYGPPPARSFYATWPARIDVKAAFQDREGVDHGLWFQRTTPAGQRSREDRHRARRCDNRSL
jgi:hypothetical protein